MLQGRILLTFSVLRAFSYLLEAAADLLRSSGFAGSRQNVPGYRDVAFGETAEGSPAFRDRSVFPQP